MDTSSPTPGASEHDARVRTISRSCPMCDSTEAIASFEMTVRQFTRSNPGYHHELISNLGFDDDETFTIVRCVDCGFVYSQHRLVDELAGYLYGKVIDHVHSKAKVLGSVKRRRLLKLWSELFTLTTSDRDKISLRVLDFGCGWGEFLMVAQSPGVACLGFEIDQEKKSWAESQGISITDDERELDSAGPFDVIVANQVLEHVPCPLETVQRFRNWLAPDGVIFLSVPNCAESEIQKAIQELKLGRLPVKEFNPWEHLNYFSPTSFRELVSKAGLEVIADDRGVGDGRIVRLLRRIGRPKSVQHSTAKSRGTSLYCRRSSKCDT